VKLPGDNAVAGRILGTEAPVYAGEGEGVIAGELYASAKWRRQKRDWYETSIINGPSPPHLDKLWP
jgi:hypothetical protein